MKIHYDMSVGNTNIIKRNGGRVGAIKTVYYIRIESTHKWNITKQHKSNEKRNKNMA